MDSKALATNVLLLLLALLFQCLSLITAADTSQLVTNLPGQPKVGFKQYAGQVVIDAKAEKSFFYWFYEADYTGNGSSLPLVLWLNGGPGCSSVGAGALGELGPFYPNDDGSGLNLNPSAWNKAANMIFLESPAGVGFSYSKGPVQLTDEQTATDNLAFLVEWFKKFSEYSKNEFYVTGESYAGHYIPTLAAKILAYNAQGGSINFKGFAIGNAWTSAIYDEIGNLEFLYSHSLISDGVYNQAMTNCYSSNGNPGRCNDAIRKLEEMTEFVDPYNVYKKVCGSTRLSKRSAPPGERLGKVYATCVDSVSSYLNSPDVQAALHVENRPVTWSACNNELNSDYSGEDVEASMLPVYEKLLKAGLRIWIYSGDFDSVVSTLSTRGWMKTLNLTIQTPWYPWDYQNQVGGWTQAYSELNFVTIRGAGHMVPADQPGPALAMFQSFLKGKLLESF